MNWLDRVRGWWVDAASVLAGVSLLLFSPTTWGAEKEVSPTAASPNVSPLAARRPVDVSSRILGLSLDAGFPDGLAASLVVRPLRPLRLDAGLTWNVLAFGVRGGATVAPFGGGFTPILRGEVGRAFGSDATGLVARYSNLSPAERTLLRHVGYDYASLQLGVEIGSPERFQVFLRGGLTWFWTTAKDFQAALEAANPGARVQATGDPRIHGTAPSVALGVVYYLW